MKSEIEFDEDGLVAWMARASRERAHTFAASRSGRS